MIKFSLKVWLSFCLLFNFPLNAQTYFDYSFIKDNSILVYKNAVQPFKYPWTGGMNNVQAGRLDLDGDGIKDLILFEQHGNKILPFVQTFNGEFEYAPEYALCFPPSLTGFLHIIDFDGDNKEDLFTYQNAGIKVYRNVSDTALKFELFSNQLLSLQGQSETNIFCTEGDYIAIYDMDNDGDLDILTFWVLGKYVQFHQNLSMELYGNHSSLEFKLKESCWGHFAESEEDNTILLDQYCNGYNGIVSQKRHRHTGSSMLILDADGNHLPDLLLGDFGYPNLVLLTNEGTIDSAHISSIDTLFPSYDVPVMLYSMPCPMLIDIDGDGVKDLLVSPIDFTFKASENKNSLWYYKNTGTLLNPHFSLQSRSFLQDEMLDFGSGAYPVFCDLNQDGLMDILVGNYGYFDSATTINASTTAYYSASLAFLKNIGSRDMPRFEMITDDLGDLRRLGLLNLTPTVGDINGDGKPDLLLGTGNQLIYLENTSLDTNLTFAPAMLNYMGLQTPPFPAVQLFDLDNDGLTDLIVGNQRGYMTYYRNTGTTSVPVFTKTIDTLGKINVRDFDNSYFGYATPCFLRTSNNETRLFIASESGNIIYYKNIDDNLYGTFTKETDSLFWVKDDKAYPIKEGMRTAVSVYDIDNDGFLDMIVGNYAGGLSFYKGIQPIEKKNHSIVYTKKSDLPKIRIYPNPVQTNLIVEIEDASCFDKLAIYNMVGELLLEKNISGAKQTDVNISDFPSGIYILQCRNGNFNEVCIKFVKL